MLEMVVGVLIILIFGGAILIALVQIVRGRFKVDYDKLAQEAMQSHREAKKQRR